MQTKKIQSEVTYLKKTTSHELELNGKTVRVYEHQEESPNDPSDHDTIIDLEDFAKLTELEQEYLGENLTELLSMKDGEIIIETE